MEKSTFGQFVYKKRREMSLTQRELAERLYVTESAVSKWERGISYPDISLVPDLCAVLGISEHELITSSEDTRQRKIERQAATLRKMRRGYLVTWYAAFGISLLTCFIVNLAVERRLSWFLIVFPAESLAFALLVLPVLLKERPRGFLLSMGAAYAALHLLLLICCLFAGGRWFWLAAAGIALGCSTAFLPIVLRRVYLPAPLYRHKALLSMAVDTLLLFTLLIAVYAYLGNGYGQMFGIAIPVALYWLPLPWGFLLTLRYLPANGLLRAAVCTALAAVMEYFAYPMMEYLMGGQGLGPLPGINFLHWMAQNAAGDTITINGNIAVLALGAAVLLGIGGAVKAVKGKGTRSAAN